MSVDTEARPDDGTNVLAQLLGVLLAPLAYLAGLQLTYQLVPHDCHVQDSTLGHLLHAGTVLLCLAGLGIAWRVWRSTSAATLPEDAGPAARTKFLGLVGTLMSALFVWIALAQWMAVFFLSPCQ
ncbi:MAG TPA: hypothetical protein VFS40_08210 [Gemmatimonadales bacterium]|nr:hypothetical protein [Gemmatimonadales bacterium]